MNGEKMKIGYGETFPVLNTGHWIKPPLEVEITLPIDLLTATDEEIENFMQTKVRRVQYALQKQVRSFFYESKGSDEKKEKEQKQLGKIEVNVSSAIAEIFSCKKYSDLTDWNTFVQTHQEKYPDLKSAYTMMEKKLKPIG